MTVSVVIPNWNGMPFLPALFEDLRAQTTPPVEITVVDNGSTDGSVDWCLEKGARVVSWPVNRGFAAAVNEGVHGSSGDPVAILNNDVRLSPQWLETLAGAMAGHAFVCGKVLSLSDRTRIDATFDALSLGGTALRCGNGKADGPAWSQPVRAYFAPFTAVLVRRAAYLDAGGLDEAFESYLEDVDFGLRCASKRYTGYYVPEAIAWHAGSGTLGRWHPRTVRQISRNQVFLLSRHYPTQALFRFGWKIAVAQSLWGAVAMRNGRGVAWVAGKFEGMRRFRELRTPGSAAALPVIAESERQILQLQSTSDADTYWRWYFRLTGK